MQHGEHRRRLQDGTVVAVQDGLVAAQGGNAFSQRRAPHQVRGVIGIIGVVHFPADDLAAVQIQDQVQVEPAPQHKRG